jgi:hypothetical protein
MSEICQVMANYVAPKTTDRNRLSKKELLENEQFNKLSNIQRFEQSMKEKQDTLYADLYSIAVDATDIPLSLFSEFFHAAFTKKKFLESMLELLQQFSIRMMQYSCNYLLFPGDFHHYAVMCSRCRKHITPHAYLHDTLESASIAILWHLGIVTNSIDSCYIPVMFPDHETFIIQSRDIFSDFEVDFHVLCENNVLLDKETKENKSNCSQTLMFCEASKMDLFSASTIKKNEHEEIVLATSSLMDAIFFSCVGVGDTYEHWFGLTEKTNHKLCIQMEKDDVAIWNTNNSTKAKNKFIQRKNLREVREGLQLEKMPQDDYESLTM